MMWIKGANPPASCADKEELDLGFASGPVQSNNYSEPRESIFTYRPIRIFP